PFLYLWPCPAISPLFPYATLFRSRRPIVASLRGQGYFVTASRLARVRLRPAGRPSSAMTFGSIRVIRRNVCALPSKPPMSLHRRSEAHTSELQSRFDLVCRTLLA